MKTIFNAIKNTDLTVFGFSLLFFSFDWGWISGKPLFFVMVALIFFLLVRIKKKEETVSIGVFFFGYGCSTIGFSGAMFVIAGILLVYLTYANKCFDKVNYFDLSLTSLFISVNLIIAYNAQWWTLIVFFVALKVFGFAFFKLRQQDKVNNYTGLLQTIMVVVKKIITR